MDRKYGRFIHDIKNIREKSDYSFEDPDELETKENYETAISFLMQVDQLIGKINAQTIQL